MKPLAFAIFAALSLGLGGVGGALLGASVPYSPNIDRMDAALATSDDATVRSAQLQRNIFREALDAERRKWGAGGSVAGAALGLAFAGVVGAYGLRDRGLRGEA